MMPGEGEGFASAGGGGTMDDIGVGAVMLDHVEIGGGEILHSMPQIAGDSEGFEEHFRQDDSGTQVDDNSIR